MEEDMKAEQIYPVGDRVLVRWIRETESKGGVLIPEQAQEKQLALVLRVGEAVTRFRPGDVVLAPALGGEQLKTESGEGCNAEELMIVREELIIAVVTDGAAGVVPQPPLRVVPA
jgi:co-chaperonin GroES (HSP10)